VEDLAWCVNDRWTLVPSGLATIWKQVPERCRKEALALWAQLIAAAAQRRSKQKGARS